MIVSVTSPSLEKHKASYDWFVYILECKDSSLYTGITNSLENRIKAHNSGKGAKYTRARGPVVLRYYERVRDKSTAAKRECAIKKLSHQQKLNLISTIKKRLF